MSFASQAHIRALDSKPRLALDLLPFVSVVVPCRNEERYIRNCLSSIGNNDYPKERLEVMVVDGMSSDRTRQIVKEVAAGSASMRIIDNLKYSIPAAMNLGIRNARGEVILKIDAHSTYPSDYISQCIRFLHEYDADDVGGVLRIMPGDEGAVARAIAQTLSHLFGSGNAPVKVGSKDVGWSDSAAFGCFKKKVFETVGLWNEDLAGSSDFDFNVRLRKAGGRILLVPSIQIDYFADRNLGSFWSHNFSDGVWATYVLKFRSEGWAVRHWVPLAFVSSLIGSAAIALFIPAVWWGFFTIAGVYLTANLAASLQLSHQAQSLKSTPISMMAFASRHVAHGLGALFGLFMVILPGKHWQGRRRARI